MPDAPAGVSFGLEWPRHLTETVTYGAKQEPLGHTRARAAASRHRGSRAHTSLRASRVPTPTAIEPTGQP